MKLEMQPPRYTIFGRTAIFQTDPLLTVAFIPLRRHYQV
jgi:hypothetical protein